MTQGGKGMMTWEWQGMLGGLVDDRDVLDQSPYLEQSGIS